jgi:hypothetical protein
MPRWSDPIKLTDHAQHSAYLDYAGCYEIGYYRGGYFTAYYVGRSTNLRRRLASYTDPLRCHNTDIHAKIGSPRRNLYFRILRTERHHGLEARLQRRFGVGRNGAYAWNRRIEWSHVDS